jgi:ABC-type sugar transport system ATPase subunit
MATVEFDHAGKQFAETVAVADFTPTVADGELITVSGPRSVRPATRFAR